MKKTLIPFFILLLAALACNLPFPGATTTPIPPNDWMTEPPPESPPDSGPDPAPPDPEPAPAVLTIVYARVGNITLWREGSAPQTLTSTGRDNFPRISDDGQMIAFVRDDELYAIRADGSDERLLVSLEYLNSFKPAEALNVEVNHFDFLPGSYEIFFDLGGNFDPFWIPVNDLHRVDAQTGETALLLASGSGGEWTFSPDGQRFVLAQAEAVRVLNRDASGDRVVLTFPFVSTYSEWVYYPQVIWANDSSGFYTVIPASQSLDNPTETSKYYFISLTESPALLTEFITAPLNFAHISSEGLQVAYVSEAPEAQHLLVYNAAEDTTRFLASGEYLSIMNWNPDSQRVAYQADDPLNPVLQALDGAPVPLSDTRRFFIMRWVSESRYLFLNEEELRLRELPAASVLIDNSVSAYDFVFTP
jgi:dipeptidyl aminopeptidase/acylaminoacyl peptidase